MFKCQICNSQSEANTSPVKVVLVTRKRKFENQVRGKNDLKAKIIVSEGWEVVREVSACKPCADARQPLN